MARQNHSDTRSVSPHRGLESTPLGESKAVARARRIIDSRARHDKRLKPGSYQLYSELDDNAGNKLVTWWHQDTLAGRLGVKSERTVIRRLKPLVEHGYIRKRKTQSGNVYRLAAVEAFLRAGAAETVSSQVTIPAPAYENLGIAELVPSDRTEATLPESPACGPRSVAPVAEQLADRAAAGGRPGATCNGSRRVGEGRSGGEVATEAERDALRRNLQIFVPMMEPEIRVAWNVDDTINGLLNAGWRLGLTPFAVAAFLFRLYNRVATKRSSWPQGPRWFRSCLDNEYAAAARARLAAEQLADRAAAPPAAAAIAPDQADGEPEFSRELVARALASVASLR